MPIDITAIILTHNEELHLDRCLKSIQHLISDLIIIDSYSVDKTLDIAKKYGARVHQREWMNYSDQLNWALDHCDINTSWVMRIDANEYFSLELQEELRDKKNEDFEGVHGIRIELKVVFRGTWIKYGGFYPQKELRIWQNIIGRPKNICNDGRPIVNSNNLGSLKGQLVDDNLRDFSSWIYNLNKYAVREAIDLITKYYPEKSSQSMLAMTMTKENRQLKMSLYHQLPLLIRPFLFFGFRYFIKLGFLDGKNGFIFHLFQGLWYRYLVDVTYLQMQKERNSMSLDGIIEKFMNGVKL